MASWNIPALINKISEDVPAIKALLTALFKWTDAGTEDVPEGAKRLQSVTGGRQIQEYSGSSWGSVGKLMHDVDMLDGKHASTAQTPDTIPVRDANGSIPGNITGNAATATTASSVSSEYVVPIANGGTGATSAANARTNLGTDNAENITQGVLATARGGTGRSDGKVTDVFLTDLNTGAVGLGQLGYTVVKDGVDCNTLVNPGKYYCSGTTIPLHYPVGGNQHMFLEVARTSYGVTVQRATRTDAKGGYIRFSSNSGASWNPWMADGVNFGGDIHIYVSKGGSDSNSGLDPTAPVLTIGRAQDIARGCKTNGSIRFHVGPGEWGTWELRCNTFQCTFIYVVNYPDSQKTTVADFNTLTETGNTGNQPPHFTTITAFDGCVHFGNISVDIINLNKTYFHTGEAISFCRFQIKSAWAQVGPHTIRKDASITNSVFWLEQAFLYIPKTSNVFLNSPTNVAFLDSSTGGGFVKIDTSATWSGSFAGQKYRFDGPIIVSQFSLNPNSFPGSQAGAGSYFMGNNLMLIGNFVLYGTYPHITCKYSDIVKGTAPSATRWNQWQFQDKNGSVLGGVEHGFGSDLVNRINLIAYRGATSDTSVNCQIAVGYDGYGNWFTYTPTPTAADNSTKIANTAWVRSATGNTNLNAAACRGNAATAPTAAACSGNSATASVASKLGTANVGSYNQPIYLENGVPKASGLVATSNNASLTKGTAPSSAVWTRSWITFDSKGTAYENRVHEIRSCVDTGQTVFYELLAYSFKSGVADPAVLGVYNNGSSKWATCPTPAANSNDTKIATTAWVRGRLSGSEYGMVPSANPEGRSVGATYTAGTNGFFKVETNNIGDYWAGVWINGHESRVHIGEYGSGGNWSGNLVFIPVKKGWTYSCYSCSWCGFQPC